MRDSFQTSDTSPKDMVKALMHSCCVYSNINFTFTHEINALHPKCTIN